ncbi:MAG: TolC family protein [Pseudomonadota bacterium]
MKTFALRCLWIGLVLVFLVMAPGVSAAERVFTLDESIETALKQSVLIRAAQEGVLGAEAQKKEAFTGFLPKLSTSYSYTWLNTAPYSYMPPIPPLTTSWNRLTVGSQDNYAWVVEAKQPLFAGGGIAANYEAGKIGFEISQMEKNAVTQDIVQEVKVSYFNILKAEKLLGVARQSLEQLQAHRNVAQNFFDVGLIPRNDLLQSEVQVANGEQFLIRMENSVELAKSKFNTILRRNINEPVQVEDILAYRPYDLKMEDCIRTAMENRPEIKSQALKVDQAKSLVKAARSDFFPTLSAVGHYERVGDTPGVAGTPFKDSENWYVMGVASWTFWEWGKTKYRVDASRSRENQSIDLLNNTRDQIALEVKNAYLVILESEKQVMVTKKAIEQAQENFRINEERYREQVATSTDVLDAQTLLTRAKSDYANALGEYNISYARLERAMGVIHTKK